MRNQRRVGEIDWNGIFNSATTAASNIVQSSNQLKAQQAAANSSAQAAAWGQPYNAYPATTGAGYVQPSIIPGVPNIALLAGAALIAFMVLRKK